MPGLTIDTPGFLPPGLTARPSVLRGSEAQQSFRDVLGIARGRTPPARAEARPQERAAIQAARAEETRRTAEQFVAKAFVEPVLASLREHSQAAPPFAPTQAEKQFRALADARLAQDVVRHARLPIVERLARDLLA